jgi:hypothetical protein
MLLHDFLAKQRLPSAAMNPGPRDAAIRQVNWSEK